MNILIAGQFDRNSANIAKLCARAFEQGPVSFRRVLEKFGGSNSQKYMSCSCREVEIFIAIHIYLKPDSPFSFCDLSVYMPVQLRASPPLAPLNYFSLPPPPPPRAHTHLKESVGKDRFGKISPTGVIEANLRDLFRLNLGNIRETSSSHVPQF